MNHFNFQKKVYMHAYLNFTRGALTQKEWVPRVDSHIKVMGVIIGSFEKNL